MRVQFYAAVLLGLATANAVVLQNEDDFDNEVASEYEFSQLDLESSIKNKGETDTAAEGEGEAGADADASNVIKVNIPECQQKPDPDALIMEAVNDLNAKSSEMAKALRLAFARSARLAATRTMEVKGCISLTPKITEPLPPPTPSTINIANGGGGCGGSTQLQVNPPVCPTRM